MIFNVIRQQHILLIFHSNGVDQDNIWQISLVWVYIPQNSVLLQGKNRNLVVPWSDFIVQYSKTKLFYDAMYQNKTWHNPHTSIVIRNVGN